MKKTQCLNCRYVKNIIEFPIMRISVSGRALFCIECMERLKDKPDFWYLYADWQNEYPLTVAKFYNSSSPFYNSENKTDKIIYPKCVPALPFIPKNHNNKTMRTRTPSPARIDEYKIIQYNEQGFEIAAYDNIFIASTKTGLPSNDIARVLDNETPLNGFKFVHGLIGKEKYW